jgi:hypothetical protein
MASTTVARLTDASAPVPSLGTAPMAANTLIPKGTIVALNATGYAVTPATASATGFRAYGVSRATFDNRTGSEAGGTAGDLDCEVDFGVFGFDISGTTPLPSQSLYVVDNQTVSIDSLGGTRGLAGPCIEVRTMNGVAQAFVFISPHLATQVDPVGTLAAFAAGDTAPASITHNAHYDVPTTAANSTISLPAATALPNGLTAYFHADGTKNGHTLTFRDVATAISAATTASKRVLAIASVMDGKWQVTLTVGP